MGFRFSKSFKLGPTRINLSKSGIGMSVGANGVRVGAGPRGAYATVGLPGTGISHTVHAGTGRRRARSGDSAGQQAALKSLLGCLGIAFLAVTELILVAAVPPVGLPLAVVTIGVFAWWRRRKRKDPEWQYQNKGKDVIQHVNNGEWDAALQAIEACEQIVPGKAETSGLKGQILFQMGRFEETIPCLRAGLATEPETLMLAEALRHVGNYRESLEALKRPPLDEMLALQALVVRAANHVELEEPETAIEILKTAPLTKRNLDDTLKQPHFVMAKAYEKAGKHAEAVKHLRKVYAADPGFMDVESELRRLQAL